MLLSALRPTLRPLFEAVDPADPVKYLPPNLWDFAFDCPSCGSPCRIFVRIGAKADEKARVWEASPLPSAWPYPIFPDNIAPLEWVRQVSLTPSINYTVAGHGPRRAKCGWHGNIIEGHALP